MIASNPHSMLTVMGTDENFTNPRYTELIIRYLYVDHVVHIPVDQWLDGINRAVEHFNTKI